MEWILQGAAPMPPSLVHRWADLIGAERIVMAYGMTEGLGHHHAQRRRVAAAPGQRRPGLPGDRRPHPRRRRRRPAAGRDRRDLPAGPTSAGYDYLGRAPHLRPTEDGFQTVGDIGYLDDDGYLYIADRRVDLIVTGGANVFPAEVEAALIDHPESPTSSSSAYSDPEWGHRVHAIVEPSDPADRPPADDVIALGQATAGRLQGAEDRWRWSTPSPAARPQGQPRPLVAAPRGLTTTPRQCAPSRSVRRPMASRSVIASVVRTIALCPISNGCHRDPIAAVVVALIHE